MVSKCKTLLSALSILALGASALAQSVVYDPVMVQQMQNRLEPAGMGNGFVVTPGANSGHITATLVSNKGRPIYAVEGVLHEFGDGPRYGMMGPISGALYDGEAALVTPIEELKPVAFLAGVWFLGCDGCGSVEILYYGHEAVTETGVWPFGLIEGGFELHDYPYSDNPRHVFASAKPLPAGPPAPMYGTSGGYWWDAKRGPRHTRALNPDPISKGTNWIPIPAKEVVPGMQVFVTPGDPRAVETGLSPKAESDKGLHRCGRPASTTVDPLIASPPWWKARPRKPLPVAGKRRGFSPKEESDKGLHRCGRPASTTVDPLIASPAWWKARPRKPLPAAPQPVEIFEGTNWIPLPTTEVDDGGMGVDVTPQGRLPQATGLAPRAERDGAISTLPDCYVGAITLVWCECE